MVRPVVVMTVESESVFPVETLPPLPPIPPFPPMPAVFDAICVLVVLEVVLPDDDVEPPLPPFSPSDPTEVFAPDEATTFVVFEAVPLVPLFTVYESSVLTNVRV